MKVKVLNILVLTAILSGLLTATDALAEERQLLTDRDGFCSSLRLLNKQLLTRHIQESRTRLRQQQADLRAKVKNQRFSGLDTIITIALPGGLLYAAIKHNAQLDERRQLERVTREITQLSGDLLTFQSAASSLQVAALD